MDSQEILGRMRDAYDSFDSYSDTGYVESPGLCEQKLQFHTDLLP